MKKINQREADKQVSIILAMLIVILLGIVIFA